MLDGDLNILKYKLRVKTYLAMSSCNSLKMEMVA